MKRYAVKEVGIEIPVPQSYKDCIELIRSDYFRIKGKNNSPLYKMFCYTLVEPCFCFTFWYRLASFKNKSLLYVVSKLIHRRNMFKYGLIIPSTTKIGYGLYIGHPTGIVINHTAVIGNNCNLSQFTSIGSNKISAAIIGDNVYIGPNVSIVENVKIGSNVTIGAGSVVVKDIESNSVAVGVPAKKIKEQSASTMFIYHKYTAQHH